MTVSLSTRNQWELIFSPTICDVKRATLHNIYLYHHAVCNSKLTSLIRTPVDTDNGHFPLCPVSQVSYIFKPALWILSICALSMTDYLTDENLL